MTGIYVGAKYSELSKQKLVKIINELEIPNPVAPKDLHTTIIYSRINGKVNLSKDFLAARLYKIDYFTSRKDERVCVLLLQSRDFMNEHMRIMSEDKNLTYDYDRYIPHITLSYNVPLEFNVQKKFEVGEDYLLVAREYEEELKEL